jgi:hypothetical protein
MWFGPAMKYHNRRVWGDNSARVGPMMIAAIEIVATVLTLPTITLKFTVIKESAFVMIYCVI